MAAARISPALKLGWLIHRWLYRLSRGRFGTNMNGFEILLLTTHGRRSGEPRRVALQHLEHGDALAVIASRAGDDRHPDWWLNLVAEPRAEAQIGARRFTVQAREATGEEREGLWARFAAIDPAYEEYRRRASRVIPVVVLEPAA